MTFKKLTLALTLAASFGLMACGDDSSSSPTKPQEESADSKSSDSKSSDSKSADSKSADSKSADSKSADSKSADSKSSDSKSEEKDKKKSDDIVQCTFTSEASSFTMIATDGDITVTAKGSFKDGIYTLISDEPESNFCNVNNVEEDETCVVKDGVTTYTSSNAKAEEMYKVFAKMMKSTCEEMDGKKKAEIEGDIAEVIEDESLDGEVFFDEEEIEACMNDPECLQNLIID